MKKQADRLIAEKLSSLESLPDGYNPNLDAKWSIIQQAAAKKKVFGYRKLVGIAASILLLIGFFITWNFLGKSTSPVITQKEQKNGIRVPVEQKSNEQFTLATQQEKTHSNKHARIIKPVKSENNLMENKIANQEIIQTTIEEPVVETASIPEPERIKNKQRYVEVNFNDPVGNDNSREKNSAQVKVKISFKKDSEPSANSENNSSLRIRQNF